MEVIQMAGNRINRLKITDLIAKRECDGDENESRREEDKRQREQHLQDWLEHYPRQLRN